MWFEILPVMAIMTGCLCTPPVAAYFVHKLFQKGNVSIGPCHYLDVIFVGLWELREQN